MLSPATSCDDEITGLGGAEGRTMTREDWPWLSSEWPLSAHHRTCVSTVRLAAVDSTTGRVGRRIDLCTPGAVARRYFRHSRQLCNWVFWGDTMGGRAVAGQSRPSCRSLHGIALHCLVSPRRRNQPVAGASNQRNALVITGPG